MTLCQWCQRPVYGAQNHRCCLLAAFQGQSGCRSCRASWAAKRPETVDERAARLAKRAKDALARAPRCARCGAPILASPTRTHWGCLSEDERQAYWDERQKLRGR